MLKLSLPPEYIADRFDIPAEIFPGIPKITLAGRTLARVENHGGILKYSRELIEVDGKLARIIIRGDDLHLVAMTRSDMLISGRILSAQYV